MYIPCIFVLGCQKMEHTQTSSIGLPHEIKLCLPTAYHISHDYLCTAKGKISCEQTHFLCLKNLSHKIFPQYGLLLPICAPYLCSGHSSYQGSSGVLDLLWGEKTIMSLATLHITHSRTISCSRTFPSLVNFMSPDPDTSLVASSHSKRPYLRIHQNSEL